MSNIKTKPKFRRGGWYKVSKLGLHRKKKQVWRRPKGRHNKMRVRWKSRGKRPSRGYGAAREERYKITGLIPKMIFNVNDLIKMKNTEIGIIGGTVGALKREEIAKKAIEQGKKFNNFNPKEFLNNLEKEMAKRKEERQRTEKKEKKMIAKTEEKPTEKEIKEEKEAEKKEEKRYEEKEKEVIKHETIPPAEKPELTEKHKGYVHHQTRIALEK